MKATEKQPVAREQIRHTKGALIYLLCSAAVSLGVVLASGRVSPPVVGGGIFLLMILLGLYIFARPHRPIKVYARWRDMMPCYLSIQDRNLIITDANDLFMRDFGDRVGDPCYRAYKDSDEPCPECPVLLSFEDGKVHTSEETVKGLDGTIEHVIVTSSPLLDKKGRIAAVVEMSTNVTELKKLEQELDKTRRNYQQLFEAVPCYICVLDRDLKILESNNLYRQDFGVSEGAHCFEACKNRTEKCPGCLVEQTFSDGKVHSSEETLTTKQGKSLNLIVYSMPIRDSGGTINSVMEVFTDITEVKRLQRELTLMGRAVAGMAHRIKNILMGLEGGIFVVNTGMESDNQDTIEEGWEMVERNVSRVSALVKDLLFCSKEREPEFKPDVNPAEVMKDVAGLFADRIVSEGIEFVRDTDPALRPGAYDASGLHSMLSNLLANAVDACRFDQDESKGKHSIHLRCMQESDTVTVFEVEDNGSGIPEEFSDRVFEDFFSSKGTEGTGLGLLVVQKVAQEHGGNVTFESQPGKGTKFRVEIPSADRN